MAGNTKVKSIISHEDIQDLVSKAVECEILCTREPYIYDNRRRYYYIISTNLATPVVEVSVKFDSEYVEIPVIWKEFREYDVEIVFELVKVEKVDDNALYNLKYNVYVI